MALELFAVLFQCYGEPESKTDILLFIIFFKIICV